MRETIKETSHELPTEKTMWLLVGGVVAIIIGLVHPLRSQAK